MKNLFAILFLGLLIQKSFAQSTTLTPGSILPNMTTMQRTEVLNPPNGMLVFDSNTQSYWFRQNGAWVELPKGGSTSNYWELNGANGNELKNTNSGGFWSANATGLSDLSDNISNPPTAPVSGAGTRMMWIPSRSAFRAGTVDGTIWDANSLGLFSFATGFNTGAFGKSSVALGDLSYAESNNSVAIGLNTIAGGTGSTSIGNFNLSEGNASFTFGEGCYSSYGMALGYSLNNKVINSVVLGAFNNSNDNLSNSYNATDRLFQLGNGTSNTARSNAITVLKNGKVGLNNENIPDSPLHIKGFDNTEFGHLVLENQFNSEYASLYYNSVGLSFKNSSNSNSFYFRNSVGNPIATIYNNGSMLITGTLTQNSDLRLKTNLTKVQNSGTKLAQLQAYHYNWKAEDRESGVQTGLIAQEVQKQFPELVKADEEGYLSVNYIGLIPHLIEAHKELKAENELLKERLKIIEEKLSIENQTASLK